MNLSKHTQKWFLGVKKTKNTIRKHTKSFQEVQTSKHSEDTTPETQRILI